MKIDFCQIDPRPQGEDANNDFFSKHNQVLGLEVTIPKYAEMCTSGNLDHHGPGTSENTPSACEQASEVCLQEITAMVTVRPDGDSITAMAVIKNRLEGLEVDAEVVFAVGLADRLGPKVTKDDRVVAINRVASNFKLTLEDRVNWISELLTGDSKEEEIQRLVQEASSELVEARKNSEVKIYKSLGCKSCGFVENFTNTVSEYSCHRCGSPETFDLPSIVTVVSQDRFATNLGYESAPIVVAMNPEFPLDPRDPEAGSGRKFTVCRYDNHVSVDLVAVMKELNTLEEGWGGRDTIIGSPQGKSSKLNLETVLKTVLKYVG